MNGTHINFPKPVSDGWSFVASLYQLLTMKFPYRFDPKRDPIDIILNENPVPIRDRMPGLDKKLAAIIDKALERNPKDCFLQKIHKSFSNLSHLQQCSR